MSVIIAIVMCLLLVGVFGSLCMIGILVLDLIFDACDNKSLTEEEEEEEL